VVRAQPAASNGGPARAITARPEHGGVAFSMVRKLSSGNQLRAGHDATRALHHIRRARNHRRKVAASTRCLAYVSAMRQCNYIVLTDALPFVGCDLFRVTMHGRVPARRQV